jgi:5-methylcytosine-specific restriction endonuclease McrA
MAVLADIETELAAIAARFDASTLLGSEAVAVLRRAARIKNLAAGIEMAAAKRAADTPIWKHQGHRTPAEWLARETKSSVGDAIGVLETAERLDGCPQVEAKVRAGELTPGQARALTRAVSADPTTESQLLGVAEADGLKGLQQRCRDVEHAAAGDADARHARIHRDRSLRHWTDPHGAFCLAATLTPDAGARVLGALAPFEKAAFDQARTDGRHEPHHAYRADALVAMADTSLTGATSDGPKTGCRKPSYTVLVDGTALLRGHTEAGERCEIPGIGAVAVSVLHQQADAAIWHILATDGTDLRTYASGTRHIPTMLRVALEARDRTCVVPGCDTATGLEIDHTHPLETGGITSYDNLARLCHHHHHHLKHQQGWQLTGGPDRWALTAPDDPDPP